MTTKQYGGNKTSYVVTEGHGECIEVRVDHDNSLNRKDTEGASVDGLLVALGANGSIVFPN